MSGLLNIKTGQIKLNNRCYCRRTETNIGIGLAFLEGF